MKFVYLLIIIILKLKNNFQLIVGQSELSLFYGLSLVKPQPFSMVFITLLTYLSVGLDCKLFGQDPFILQAWHTLGTQGTLPE